MGCGCVVAGDLVVVDFAFGVDVLVELPSFNL